jgi:hypothetical protein
MKNLLVFASAALVGAAAFAGVQPRVYQYTASLKTTVAKNAAKVKLADGEYLENVCYRAKGAVTVKGVIVLGCNCNEFYGWYNYGSENGIYRFDEAVKTDDVWGWQSTLTNGYPLVLMATSADKYKEVIYAGEFDNDVGTDGGLVPWLDVWIANRLGNPLSSKAKDAELAFEFWFDAAGGAGDNCGRNFWLENAGFGSAGTIETADGAIDITSISGSVVGEASAPYCTAADNNCPRCQETGSCEQAIAFTPCFDDAVAGDGNGSNEDVAYGTFTLKYNSSLAAAIKTIPAGNVQGTVNAIVPKAFGSKAVAPTLPTAEETMMP